MIENAVILAGGFGTRLQPLTFDTPKALLPVGSRPFLETQLYRLKRAGVKRVVLSVFHQAALFKKALRGLNTFGLRLSLAKEPRALGTAGAIAFAWPDRSKACLVLNGDVLSDLEIGPFSKDYLEHGAQAALWVIEVKDPSAFGVIEADRRGVIGRFVEKPRAGETKSRLINAGLYALSPQILSLIPAGRPVSIEREIFPALSRHTMQARAFRGPAKSYWNDIGTPAAYLRANLDLLEGRFKLGTFAKGLRGSSLISRSCRIGKAAHIARSVLMSGCRVGEGARIEGAILGKNCIIEAGASVREGAVLGRGTRITRESHA